MKRKHLRLAGIVVLIGMMACVLAYGDKQCKASLPDAVKAALNELYPQAAIEEAKAEKEGLKVYEITLKQNGQEFEVTVAPDGTIVETESEVSLADLPDAVKTAINLAAGGSEIEEISQEVTYAVVELIALDKPQTSYEAEVTINGKKIDIKVSADGTILSKEVKCDHEDKADDDNEDEELVSIDQVPAAVKATILAEAGTGTIKEIEIENEDGQTIYDADVIIDGQEVEIKVSADGILLSKKVEDDDEDEADDDNDDEDEDEDD